MSRSDWNEHYISGTPPWDTNQPDAHLMNLIRSESIAPCNTLEVGCGTGTNSIWLARQGFSTPGVDLSEVAVELAKNKKEDPSLSCDFQVMDFLHDETLSQSYGFVFDRGCFHVYDHDRERAQFARQVSRVLNQNGLWLSLIGSTEGGPREMGPPRRNAKDVISAIEPYLEIVELRSVVFLTTHPHEPKAWLCLARQRTEPAQPSTIR